MRRSFTIQINFQLALAKNRVSGKVNREDVYYPGCYLLTPDIELIRFQGTAHTFSRGLDILTSDKLSFNLELTLQYFIKWVLPVTESVKIDLCLYIAMWSLTLKGSGSVI